MTETLRGPNRDAVKQFSVFAENKVGRLNDLLMMLSAADIHVMAITLLDTTDSTIIRIVVDYPEAAEKHLRSAGFCFYETDVVAVEIENESALKKVTCTLVQAEINIHYIYPFVMRPGGRTGLVIRAEDQELAREVLSRGHFKVLMQSDIAR